VTQRGARRAMRRQIVPDKGGVSMCAIDHRRAGDDAVVIRWEKLRFDQRLLTAGRAAGEIGVSRLLPVEGPRDLFAGGRHQMGRAKPPVAPFYRVADEVVAVQRGRGNCSLIGVDYGIALTQSRRQGWVDEPAAETPGPGSLKDALPPVLRETRIDESCMGDNVAVTRQKAGRLA
jgi:hypothetical protein